MKNCIVGLLILLITGCANTFKEPPKKLDRKSFFNDQSDNNKQLKIIRTGPPFFPMNALNDKQLGWCVAQFDVPENGIPENIEILECSPKEYFEYGCNRIVSQLRYSPVGLPATKARFICNFRISKK